MASWNRSSKISVRFIFCTICILLSVSLIFSMFTLPSIAYAKELLDENFTILTSDDVESSELSNVNDFDETNDNGDENTLQNSGISQIRDVNNSLYSSDSSSKNNELVNSKTIGAKMTDINSVNSSLAQSDCLQGSGTEEDPYLVSSYAQFTTATAINSKVYIKLMKDIEISQDESIKRISRDFSGVLDGCGYTISELVSLQDEYRVDALFNSLNDGTVVKNLNLKMNVCLGSDKVGMLANEVNGNVTVSDCTFSGSVHGTTFTNVGWDSVEDFTNHNFFNTISSYTGGLFGYVSSGSNVSIVNVKNEASVTCDSQTTRYAGGFIGFSDDAKINIVNCENSSSVDVEAIPAMNITVKVLKELLKMVANSLLNGFAAHDVESHKALLDKKRYYADKIADSLFYEIDEFKINEAGLTLEEYKKVKESFRDFVVANFDEELFKRYSSESLANIDGNVLFGNNEPIKKLWNKYFSNKKNLPWSIRNKPLDVDLISSLDGVESYVRTTIESASKNGVFYMDNSLSTEWATLVAKKIMKNPLYEATSDYSGLFGGDPDIMKNALKKYFTKLRNAGEKIPDEFMNDNVWDNVLVSRENNTWKVTLKENDDFARSANLVDMIPEKNYKKFGQDYIACFDEVYSHGYANLSNYTFKTTTGKFKDVCQDDVIKAYKCYIDANDVWSNNAKLSDIDGIISKNLDISLDRCTSVYNNFINLSTVFGFDTSDTDTRIVLDSLFMKFAYDMEYQCDGRVPGINFDILYARYKTELSTLISVPWFGQDMKDKYRAFLSQNELSAMAMARANKNYVQALGEFLLHSDSYDALRNIDAKWTLPKGMKFVTGFTDDINDIAKDVANTLKESSGGNGEQHWNSYAGGVIAYYQGCDNSNSCITIKEFKNDSSTTGGHSAGGLIGYAEKCNIDLETAINSGSVSTTELYGQPSSGGLLGKYKSGGTGSFINIRKSMNYGTVMSRDCSGGFVGDINSSATTLNIEDCGTTGYIAGVDATGGFIGYEDSIAKLTINNSYTSCEFDTVSFDEHYAHLDFLPWLSLPKIKFESYSTEEHGIYGDTRAGSFIGSADDLNKLWLENVYYRSGNDVFGDGGNDTYKTFLNIDDKQIHCMSLDDFKIGAVTYALNNATGSDLEKFGQVIDNFSLGDGGRQYAPVPGSIARVYKDEVSAKPIYSNYNPRNIHLLNLSFSSDHAYYNPSVSSTTVVYGSDYKFNACSENGYKLSKVTVINESGTEELLSDNETDDMSATLDFTIKNIRENTTIQINSNDFVPTAPEGRGTKDDPFKIYNKAQLAWLNSPSKGFVPSNAYIDLMDDIDYSGIDWKPMFPYKNGFSYSGVFNGNGHKIYNLSCQEKNDVAFFSGIDGGVIKNLTLDAEFSNSIFAYWAKNAEFINCTAKGNVSSESRYCGGFVSRACCQLTMTNCTNEANISQNTTDADSCCGGFVGQITNSNFMAQGSNTSWIDEHFKNKIEGYFSGSFTNCINNGNIAANCSADNYAGGIAGYLYCCDDSSPDGITSGLTITKCTNNGAFADDSNNLSAGGMLGCMYMFRPSVNIFASVNNGNIGYKQNGSTSNPQICGGIIGWVYTISNGLYIDQTLNNGNVWAYGDDAGGFIGTIENGFSTSNYSVDIKNSVQLGYVHSDDNAGSLVGALGDTSNIFSKSFSGVLECSDVYVKYYDNLDLIDSDFNRADYTSYSGVTHISNDQINSGLCSMVLNGHKKQSDKEWQLKTKKDNQINYTNDSKIKTEELSQYYRDDIFGQTVITQHNSESGLMSRPYYISDGASHVYHNNGYLFSNEVFTNKSPDEYIGTASDSGVNIKVDCSDGGYVEGPRYAAVGSSNIYKVVANSGYVIDKFYDNDKEVTLDTLGTYVLNIKDINDTHTLKAQFSKTKMPALNGDEYQVSSVYELNWVAQKSKAGEKINVCITKDIEIFEGSDFDGIGSSEHPYSSRFRGLNDVIINNYSNHPLFDAISKGAEISNLSINIGKSSARFIAGLAKCAYGGSINNISVEGQAYDSNKYAAGFVSELYGNDELTIKNSVNSISIFNYDKSYIIDGTDKSYIAGFVAKVNTDAKLVISNHCVNKGLMTNYPNISSYASGAVAYSNSHKIKVEDFTNNNTIFSSKISAGVISLVEAEGVCNKQDTLSVNKCINKSNISSSEISAGIVGSCKKDDKTFLFEILQCENTGDIVATKLHTHKATCAAGIFAYADSDETCFDIKGCIVNCDLIESTVDDDDSAAGIVASIEDTMFITIDSCVAYVNTIKSSYLAGAFIANLDDKDHYFNNSYLYTPNCSKKIDDDYTAGHTDTDGYDFVDKSMFASGELAYKICSTNQYSSFGQNLDYDGTQFQDCPHINSHPVYLQNFTINNENVNLYTNYKNKMSKLDNSVYVRFTKDQNSSGGESPTSFKLEKNNSNFPVQFNPSKTCSLEYIKLIDKNNSLINTINACELNNNTYNFNYQNILTSFRDILLNKDKKIDFNTATQKVESSLIDDGIIVEFKYSKYSMPSGKGSQDSPYLVKTPYELNMLAKKINEAYDSKNGFDRCHIKLEDNIDMTGISWVPIGVVHNFYGVFDGNNKTINNLGGNCGAFINNAKQAVIKDLTLNVNFNTNTEWVGCCVQVCNSSFIENVTVTGKFSGKASLVAGIVGKVQNDEVNSYKDTTGNHSDIEKAYSRGTRIYDCKCSAAFNFSNYNSDAKVAGIVGLLADNTHLYIDNCINYTDLRSNNRPHGAALSTADWAAGMLAYCSCNVNELRIDNSINNAHIIGNNSGAMIGGVDGSENKKSKNYIKLNFNTNHGYIEGDQIGGMVGQLNVASSADMDVALTGCLNDGSVIGLDGDVSGGMVGHIDDGDFNVYINSCANQGKIMACDNAAGGIIGYAADFEDINIISCYNTGLIECTNHKSNENTFYGEDGDWFDDINVQNSYSLNNILVDRNNVPEQCRGCVNDASKFISGDIAYKLNNGKHDSSAKFAQIIDDFSFGNRQTLPIPVNGSNKAYVYLLPQDVYSNYSSNTIQVQFVCNEGGKIVETSNDYKLQAELNGVSSGKDKSTNIFSVRVPINSNKEYIVKPNPGYITKSISSTSSIENKTYDSNDIVLKNINRDIKFNIEFEKYVKPNEETIYGTDGVAKKVYDISNYNELLWFADQVNNQKNTQINARLINNIYCEASNGQMWPGIGTSSSPYKGTFDGNNKIISGLYIEGESFDNIAFMKSANGASIINLILDNTNFKCKNRLAGLVFEASNCNISKVRVYGKLTSSGANVGGLVGIAKGNTKLSNCENHTSINTPTDVHGCVGGIISKIDKNSSVELKDCINYSEIHSNKYTDGVAYFDDYCGGMVGYIDGSSADVKIETCQNKANVKGNLAGGMVAYYEENSSSSSTLTFNDCINNAWVTGDECGGLLGRVDDVKSNTKLNINRCINAGFVGSTNTTLHDAGGLVGEIDDGNLDVNLSSSFNFGVVSNIESSSDVYTLTQVFANFGMGIAGSIGDAAEGAFTQGAYIALFNFIADLSSTVIDAAWDCISGRVFMPQYAGGFIGDFNDSNKVMFENLFNFGYVEGETYSNAIAPNVTSGWASSCSEKSINCVYTLPFAKDGVDSSDNTNVNGKEVSVKDLTSGKIGYEVQEHENKHNNKVGYFGQILDNLSLGQRMAYPYLDYGKSGDNYIYAPIYYHKNSDTYSNFPEDEYYSNQQFTLDFCEHKNSDINSKVVKYKEYEDDNNNMINQGLDNLFKDFNVVVLGNRQQNSKQAVNGNNVDKHSYEITGSRSYNVYAHELLTVKFNPKINFDKSIFDITINNIPNDSANITKVVENDGTLIKYYNYRLGLDGNASCDYRVVFRTDGSVQFDSYKEIDTNDLFIDVHVVDMPIQVHEQTASVNHPTIMWAWTSTDELPNHDGNFYLSNDVTINQPYYLDFGEVGICTNSHSINLESNSTINISKDSALNFSDCQNYEQDINLYYQQGKILKSNPENKDDNQILETDKIKQDSLSLVRRGMIYSNQNVDINKPVSIFNIDGGSLTIQNVGIIKQAYSSVVDISSLNDNSNITLNTDIYRYTDTLFPTNNSAPVFNIEKQIMYKQFVLGANFVIQELNNKIETNKAVDFMIDYTNDDIDLNSDTLQNEALITADEAYNFGQQFVIDTKNVNYVKLTKNFEKQMIAGVDFTKAFITYNDNYSIALMGKKSLYSDVVLSKNDNVLSIDVESAGMGKLRNEGQIKCLKNSDIGLYYAANDGSMLYDVSSSLSTKHEINYSYRWTDPNTKEKKYNSLDIPANRTISANNTLVQQNSGIFYIENVCNTLYQFNYQNILVESPSGMDVNNFYTFNFKTNREVDSNPYGSIVNDWFDTNKLPNQASTNLDPKAYKLQNDIELNEPWNVPAGSIMIDLNGHYIKQKVKNTNVIVLNDDKCKLTIVDSRKNTSHYLKVNNVENKGSIYELTDRKSDDSVEIKGGLITGSDYVREDVYYKYDLNASAVYVEKGKLIMEAGTIAGNNSWKFKGGAAISVGDSAKAYIYNKAYIEYNTCCGDSEFLTSLMSAGIANSGYFYNAGTIRNNISDSYASSAISNSGKFDNEGKIFNNDCIKSQANNASLVYGAVYNSGNFRNSGSITDNFSDFECGAVINNGTMSLFDNSLIANNKFGSVNDSTVLDIEHLNINSPIVFETNVNPSSAAVIKVEPCLLTSGWSKVSKAASSVFNLYHDKDIDKHIIVNSDGELEVSTDSNIAQVNFIVEGNGHIKNISDVYNLNQNLNVEVLIEDGYRVYSINVNGKEAPLITDNSYLYQVDLSKIDIANSANKTVDIKVAIASIEQLNNQDTKTDWYSNKALPSIAGKYVLQSNIVLPTTWICPIGTTQIDLNGYSITPASKNMDLILLLNHDSKLTIVDSNDDIHYVTPDHKGLSKLKQEDSIRGGYIGGCFFDNNSIINNAAINVQDGQLNLEKCNICFNTIDRCGGVAGVYVGKDASATLNENVHIVFNLAKNLPEAVDFVTAGLHVAGKCSNNANIYRNIGMQGSVAGITLYEDTNSYLDQKGKIFENEAIEDSIAGIYACSGKLDMSGIIENNIARGFSTAAVEIEYANVTISGTISNNVALDKQSNPGITSFSNVFVNGQSEISNNLNKELNSVYDVKFMNISKLVLLEDAKLSKEIYIWRPDIQSAQNTLNLVINQSHISKEEMSNLIKPCVFS